MRTVAGAIVPPLNAVVKRPDPKTPTSARRNLESERFVSAALSTAVVVSPGAVVFMRCDFMPRRAEPRFGLAQEEAAARCWR
jgi:hypothetical protein